MAHYHLSCASGIAGDMFLGACLDLGMPLDVVAEAVASLGLRGVGVEQRKASRGGFAGTRFRVLLDGRPVEGPDPEEMAAGADQQARGHDHPQRPAHSHDHHEHAQGHQHERHEHAHGHQLEHHEHSHGHQHERHEHAHGHQHEHHETIHGPSHAHGSHAFRQDHEHNHGHQHEHGHAHPHQLGHDFEPGHSHHHLHESGHSHPHHHHPSSHGPGSDGLHDPRGQRDLAQIRALIGGSGLPAAVRERALRLFARLGEAEAKAHGMPLDRVHFHEVGAVDSIVDLVGAAAAVEHLAPERLTCGPVNVGGGRVHTAHGELPVPAPATAELLRGIPIHGGPGGELTTPTGALLLAELVDAFVELPALRLDGTGYGLGRKDLSMQPNAVRLLRGQALASAVTGAGLGPGSGSGAETEVAVVECEVDDLTGEGFGYLMERLLAGGALDVYFTPLVMKKSRPGVLVTLLCRHQRLDELAALLLLESGSLGCRYHLAARFEAERDFVEVATAFGAVRIKVGSLAGRHLAATPEYEDCRRLALAAGVPWREVYGAALAAHGSATAERNERKKS